MTDNGKRSVKDYPRFWFRQVEVRMELLSKLEEIGGRDDLRLEMNLSSENPSGIQAASP